MARVRDLLARKGSSVVTVDRSSTVLDAAHLMNEHHIGGVVVTSEGAPAGIFTERDILRRVVGAKLDPATTLVADVMTSAMLAVGPDTPVDECRALMSARRIRHLPVISGSDLQGLITSGDVLAWEVADSQATIQQLQDYVYYSR